MIVFFSRRSGRFTFLLFLFTLFSQFGKICLQHLFAFCLLFVCFIGLCDENRPLRGKEKHNSSRRVLRPLLSVGAETAAALSAALYAVITLATIEGSHSHSVVRDALPNISNCSGAGLLYPPARTAISAGGGCFHFVCSRKPPEVLVSFKQNLQRNLLIKPGCTKGSASITAV